MVTRGTHGEIHIENDGKIENTSKLNGIMLKRLRIDKATEDLERLKIIDINLLLIEDYNGIASSDRRKWRTV